MPDTIEKLRPDRDLQCFFFQPNGIATSIAAISQASPTGFTVSGAFRQQFDWAVIEWNRDNVFEHPAFRNLPDGDLSGLVLTYEETRDNCIPLDSDLFATVDWDYLRIWTDESVTTPRFVSIRKYAEPIEGSYVTATAEFTLSGTVVEDEYVGIAYAGEHFTYQFRSPSLDILENAVEAIVLAINASPADPPLLKAERIGRTVRVYYTGDAEIADATTGHNGNRFSMYSYTDGSAAWDHDFLTFSGGQSPTKWRVTLDFSSLLDRDDEPVPTTAVRKMRWTFAADQQPGYYEPGEFEVVISNWAVTGTGRAYSVAGPGSRRIEENDALMQYTGSWADPERGNYSGGFIRRTTDEGASVTVQYTAGFEHTLYVGTRYLAEGAIAAFNVDSTPAGSVNLNIPGEDILIRWPVGQYPAGAHTLTITHDGVEAGAWFTEGTLFIDFVELAIPTTELPAFPSMPTMTAATDWDTLHSVAIAPERTAWFIDSQGFHGRHNYYVGALLWYELHNPGNVYAQGSITFGGTADAGSIVSVLIARSDLPEEPAVEIARLIHAADTPETIAASFAGEFNRGYTGIWASYSANVLTFYSRSLGDDGNRITIHSTTTSGTLTVSPTTATELTGGVDGAWVTDLTATPRINRACRDWSVAFFQALDGYGIDCVSAFSTELKDVDPSLAAGMAQRGPAGDPIQLPTPAIQTNFSPTAVNYWKQVYADCAELMQTAGIQPYLQFGEVQWWYFPHDGLGFNYSGMPFYDDYTKAEFLSQHGYALPEFLDNDADPLLFSNEVAFLSDLLGSYTDQIMAYVSGTYTDARFEVLYPVDVNQTEFNQAINYASAYWTPASLTNLKTEALGFTFTKRLQQSLEAIDTGIPLGFSATQRSHLIGIGDSSAAWLKEARIAEGKGFESVVFFALDQFCLIGYFLPLPALPRRSIRLRR